MARSADISHSLYDADLPPTQTSVLIPVPVDDPPGTTYELSAWGLTEEILHLPWVDGPVDGTVYNFAEVTPAPAP